MIVPFYQTTKRGTALLRYRLRLLDPSILHSTALHFVNEYTRVNECQCIQEHRLQVLGLGPRNGLWNEITKTGFSHSLRILFTQRNMLLMERAVAVLNFLSKVAFVNHCPNSRG